jgi:Zn-finger nucleic acid-binding protein
MKCTSCETEINPQWRHAIDVNICPFCGSAIMAEHLKNLLSSLADTMDKLQEYSEQLDDWMLSNHTYIKTSSPNLVQYVPKEMLQAPVRVDEGFQKKKAEQDKKYTIKVQTETGEEDVLVENLQSEDKTNDFAKRAEAIKPNIEGFKTVAEKTAHLKRIAQQIKSGGSSSLINEDGGEEMISPEQFEGIDEATIAEYEALSGGHIASALPNSEEDDIPAAVLAMASKGGGGNKGVADLLKMQQQQERMRKSREAFESGENRGKGGFSRS